jgi:type VI secretion system ImpA family protein
MALDVEALLAPVEGDDPAGADLSYDAERQEIEAAFETSISDDGAGGDVDWRATIDLIASQSERTKDVWLAVYLCRAGARAGQPETVEAGAQFLAGLFERYWERVHPQLEEYGLQGRKAPCESLTRLGEFLNPVRRMELVSHSRLGSYSGADFERFRENAEAEDGYGMFRAALQDLGTEPLEVALARIDGIVDGIRRADAVLTAEAGSETGTNFAPAYDVFTSIRRAIAHFSPSSAAEPDDLVEDGGDSDDADGASASAPRVAGRIGSREDVLRAMDAIAEYYRVREPASPVPLALARAREWVNADFLSILEDIAPAGMEDVRRVLTSTPRDQEYGGGSSSEDY